MKEILIDEISFVTTRQKNILKKQNIKTIEDLLLEFPLRYEDYTPDSIENAKLDQNITLEGSIISKITINYLKNNLSTLTFLMEVENKKIKITIFNRTFLKSKLDYGALIRVHGKFTKTLGSFTAADIILLDEVSNDIVPVYSIKDIAQVKYLEMIENIIDQYEIDFEEILPKKYLEKYNLFSINKVIKKIHCPNTMNDVNRALNYLKYKELLTHQLSIKYVEYMRKNVESGVQVNIDNDVINNIISKLPYELTSDQIKTLDEISNDLTMKYPMNRLIQGEVGSGKTIVAILSMISCAQDGYQSVLMCPTEILAKQHLITINEIIKDFNNINVQILTGSTKPKERTEILDEIKNGKCNIIIGTHALFQSGVEYNKLGLVITDEEHRFGVRQRMAIKSKGQHVNYLKMTATPIPRTLATSVYGDTDISIIKTKPKNRKEVITKYISQKDKIEVVEHMKHMIEQGKQIYVVAPLINESEHIDSANVYETYVKMMKYFKNIANVGLIHGKLKPEEKDEIMEQFNAGKIDILVSTSVIEVGVNVPNATTIVILGADRFGLATLHQLRGRVMRSSDTPYCFIIPSSNVETSKERLILLETVSDGFKLAEYDMANRGVGEFFGDKQSGASSFTHASLSKDKEILISATNDAQDIINTNELFDNTEFLNLKNLVIENYNKKNEEID